MSSFTISSTARHCIFLFILALTCIVSFIFLKPFVSFENIQHHFPLKDYIIQVHTGRLLNVFDPIRIDHFLAWRPLGLFSLSIHWDQTIASLQLSNLYLICACLITFGILLYLEALSLFKLNLLSFMKRKYGLIFCILLLFLILFAAHPSIRASIGHIPAHFSLLGTLFILLTFLVLRHAPSWAQIILTPAFFFCALLSIETSFALFPLLLLSVFQQKHLSKSISQLKQFTIRTYTQEQDPLDLNFFPFLGYQIEKNKTSILVSLFVFVTIVYITLRYYFLGTVFGTLSNHYPSFFKLISSSWGGVGFGFNHYIVNLSENYTHIVLNFTGMLLLFFVFISLRLHQKHLFLLSQKVFSILRAPDHKNSSQSYSLLTTHKIDNRYFFTLKLQALYTVQITFFFLTLLFSIFLAISISSLWSSKQDIFFFHSDLFIILPFTYFISFIALVHFLDTKAVAIDADRIQRIS